MKRIFRKITCLYKNKSKEESLYKNKSLEIYSKIKKIVKKYYYRISDSTAKDKLSRMYHNNEIFDIYKHLADSIKVVGSDMYSLPDRFLINTINKIQKGQECRVQNKNFIKKRIDKVMKVVIDNKNITDYTTLFKFTENSKISANLWYLPVSFDNLQKRKQEQNIRQNIFTITKDSDTPSNKYIKVNPDTEENIDDKLDFLSVYARNDNHENNDISIKENIDAVNFSPKDCCRQYKYESEYNDMNDEYLMNEMNMLSMNDIQVDGHNDTNMNGYSNDNSYHYDDEVNRSFFSD